VILFACRNLLNEGAQLRALFFIWMKRLPLRLFTHDFDDLEFVIGNQLLSHDVFEHPPNLRMVFAHDQAEKVQLVDAERLGEHRHFIDRQLGLALLQHRDEIGLVIAHGLRDFRLLEAGSLDGLGEKIFDGDVLWNTHVLLLLHLVAHALMGDSQRMILHERILRRGLLGLRLFQVERMKLIIPILGIIIPIMGTIMQTSIASALFTSSQQRVLGLLYGRADQSFYTNEIVRLAGMGTGAVYRELKKLAAAGLLTETKIGNQARYQANPDTPVFTELRGLIVKTFGVADHLRQALAPVANQIGVAVIYGSMARGTEDVDSDVDLLLITDALAYGDVFPLLSDAETALGRPVNPSIYGRAEWERKQHEGNSFVTRLLEQPKIFLIGTESDLSKSS